MIHIELVVGDVQAGQPSQPIIDKEFNDWWEAKSFVDSMSLKMESGYESIWNNPLNEYVQVEIPLLHVGHTCDTYTTATLLVEGKEEHEGEVFIVTTNLEDGEIDMEVIDTMPTFPIDFNMMVRVANVNGGDSRDITDALRRHNYRRLKG